MPIIEPARPGTPLTQGDLLSGITLYATKGSWDERGGQASVVKSDFCPVLSRPCVAAHKKHFVAAVVKLPDNVPRNIDLTTAQEKLQQLSDRVAPYERELQNRQSPGE